MIECETIVIGAGLAGLTVASGLATAGAPVAVLEKSRGIGGRLATRRAEGNLAFDHGAQYLRPEGEKFRAFLHEAMEAGAATTWPEIDGEAAFIGLPGMNGLVVPAAHGLAIHTEIEAAGVAHSGEVWTISDEGDGPIARSQKLVLAIPAPQAKRLLGAHPLAAKLGDVAFTPCWTLLAAFDAPLALPSPSRDESAVLSWIAKDSSKPGRNAHGECWVAQAAPDWSRRNLERERDEMRDVLLAELARRLGGPLPNPIYARAHRWRYSTASIPLGVDCLTDPETGLVIVGDWCLGDRAEHAFLSGQSGLPLLLNCPA